jgi:hypothetical protein
MDSKLISTNSYSGGGGGYQGGGGGGYSGGGGGYQGGGGGYGGGEESNISAAFLELVFG